MIQAYLGIDVSKHTLDAALFHDGKRQYKVVDNSITGFRHLSAWLEAKGIQWVHVCMEATGQYSYSAAEYLFSCGYAVSVINPARIKSYADSRLTRNKTDKTDALLIAEFCQKEKPPLWSPPKRIFKELKAMVHYLDDLKSMRQQECNRREFSSNSPFVEGILFEHIALLEERIKIVLFAIHEHIQSDPYLKQNYELMVSIPGIGELTAARLLAEIHDFREFRNARQLTAYAGLNPRQYQSGSSVHRKSRLSKIGNSNLRHALYMPAIVAMQHNPIIRDFSQRLLSKGKSKITVVGASMRKMLVLVYGVIKSGLPFDPLFAQKQEIYT